MSGVHAQLTSMSLFNMIKTLLISKNSLLDPAASELSVT